MRQFFATAIIFTLCLTGCQTWSPQQINTASDDALCRHYRSSLQWKGTAVDLTDTSAIEAELSKRKLNCDPAFRYCQSIGAVPGTDAMIDCVMSHNQLTQQKALQEQQMKIEQEAIKQKRIELQKAPQQTIQLPQHPANADYRNPTTTNCDDSPFGGGITCTTY